MEGTPQTEDERILAFCYWENFKFAKELAMVLPHDHPKRIKLQTVLDEMLAKWHELQNARK